jgi:hypothetical protein
VTPVRPVRPVRQLWFWLVVIGATAATGYGLAAATSDGRPPFAASAANYLGWFTFVLGALSFLVLCGLALAAKLVRAANRPSSATGLAQPAAQHQREDEAKEPALTRS